MGNRNRYRYNMGGDNIERDMRNPEYKANERLTLEVEDSGMANDSSMMSTRNILFEQQMMQNAMKQKQMAQIMQQMQMQNMLLQQQNELQKTQIEKMDLINSARTTKKPVGPVSSPKKRGGANKNRKITIAMSQGQGTSFGYGGGVKGRVLPGGRFSKRR
tara:strand:- start:864 stop:1343 length:480 start_codon:yes stop_codon:yes gene_type:complete